MTDRLGQTTDPSVCYRHPGRQSWVLCQRCGRTVCPECQILAPVGVHCPDCVRETSGGVSWRPTNAAPPRPRRVRSRGGSASFGRARSLLLGRTGGSAPTVTWTLIGANALFLVVGLAAPGVAFLLVAQAGRELELWRYLTAALVPLSLLSFLLQALFMWLTGAQVERMLGTARFVAVVVVATVAGSCGAMLAGGVNAGLAAPLFGAFATILVSAWHDERARVQILVMLAINAVLAVVTGGAPALALIVAAFAGGAGTMWVLQHRGESAWTRSPALTLGGATAALVVLTIAKSLLV